MLQPSASQTRDGDSQDAINNYLIIKDNTGTLCTDLLIFSAF